MSPSELERIGTSKYGRWGWQRRLAEELGVNPNTVLRWRSGHSPIGESVAFRLRAIAPPEAAAPLPGPPPDYRAMLRALARDPTLRVVEEGADFRLVRVGDEAAPPGKPG